MIKKYILNLDKKIFNNYLIKIYYALYAFFKYPKITPLSKETKNYYPIKDK